MKKEELIQEIAYRLAVPEQTAGLVLHTIFNQVLVGLGREGAAGIPRLGDWRIVREESGQEIEFIPSRQFLRILGFARANPDLPPGGAPHTAQATENRSEFLPVEQLYPAARRRETAVDLVGIYRSISGELGIATPLDRTAAQPGRNLPPIDTDEILRAITIAESRPRRAAEQAVKAPRPGSAPAEIPLAAPAPPPSPPAKAAGESMVPGAGERAAPAPEAVHPMEAAVGDAESIPPDRQPEKKQGGNVSRSIAILLAVLLTLGGLYLAYIHGYLDYFLKKRAPAPVPASISRRPDSAVPAAATPRKSVADRPGMQYLLSVRITPRRYEADGRLKQIALQGFHGKVTSRRLRRGGILWYEVRLGPYSTRDSARMESEAFLNTYGFPPELDSIRMPQ